MRSIMSFLRSNGEAIGPGTDLVISLVAILLMVIAINQKIYEEEFLKVKEYQQEVIENIATMYDTVFVEIDSIKLGVSINSNGEPDVLFENYATLQRLSFGDHILFPKGKYYLNDSGKEVLSTIGSVMKDKLEVIEEIYIQGHTDSDGSDNENLLLGARRAMEVYNHLTQNVGIEPVNTLISATTFGEYYPVERDPKLKFNHEQLKEFNTSSNDKSKNRRIDIVLNYRNNLKNEF